MVGSGIIGFFVIMNDILFITYILAIYFHQTKVVRLLNKYKCILQFFIILILLVAICYLFSLMFLNGFSLHMGILASFFIGIVCLKLYLLSPLEKHFNETNLPKNIKIQTAVKIVNMKEVEDL